VASGKRNPGGNPETAASDLPSDLKGHRSFVVWIFTVGILSTPKSVRSGKMENDTISRIRQRLPNTR
jgi:hypothetical protein